LFRILSRIPDNSEFNDDDDDGQSFE